jgi:hypothetical protein
LCADALPFALKEGARIPAAIIFDQPPLPLKLIFDPVPFIHLLEVGGDPDATALSQLRKGVTLAEVVPLVQILRHRAQVALVTLGILVVIFELR